MDDRRRIAGHDALDQDGIGDPMVRERRGAKKLNPARLTHFRQHVDVIAVAEDERIGQVRRQLQHGAGPRQAARAIDVGAGDHAPAGRIGEILVEDMQPAILLDEERVRLEAQAVTGAEDEVVASGLRADGDLPMVGASRQATDDLGDEIADEEPRDQEPPTVCHASDAVRRRLPDFRGDHRPFDQRGEPRDHHVDAPREDQGLLVGRTTLDPRVPAVAATSLDHDLGNTAGEHGIDEGVLAGCAIEADRQDEIGASPILYGRRHAGKVLGLDAVDPALGQSEQAEVDTVPPRGWTQHERMSTLLEPLPQEGVPLPRGTIPGEFDLHPAPRRSSPRVASTRRAPRIKAPPWAPGQCHGRIGR